MILRMRYHQSIVTISRSFYISNESNNLQFLLTMKKNREATIIIQSTYDEQKALCTYQMTVTSIE